MAFQIIRNDITKVKADAIVNTANPEPVYAGGTDAAIYMAAGAEELLTERKKIGKIETGQVAVTPAFSLSAKYIIHTVGPSWRGGGHGEREAVRSCYENSLRKAQELGCESVAFPLIATGVYGFPKAEALQIAVNAFSEFLSQSDMQIILVVFDEESFVLSGRIFSGIDTYIDENYVTEATDLLDSPFRKLRAVTEDARLDTEENVLAGNKVLENAQMLPAPAPVTGARSLEDLMEQVAETWQERLFRLIAEKGYSDVEVYKRANVDRKLFSKIRGNADYQPKKITAVAFALALKLNLDETRDFLERAGYALSPSSRFDLIIKYFIEQGVYDTYTINLALFEHRQPMLGE